MEIRIKISDAEYSELENRAKAAGLPSVNAYAHNLLFPQHDYERKWAEVKAYISKIKHDRPFYIRDALPNTPAAFGRYACNQQAELGIEFAGKDRQGTNLWRKRREPKEQTETID